MRLKHLALAIPLLFLAADGPQLPTPANPSAILQWDAPTTNADGTACTDLGGYVVAISDATVDLSAGGTPLAQVQVADPALTQQAIAPLVSGRAAGLYRLWVRAHDLAGNVSTWSEPFLVLLDPIGPQRPGNLRMKITVIVEVQ
jgi:hypothetical protein